MNKEFTEIFEPFLLKMAKLHYRIKSESSLTNEDNKTIECVSCLIPIFNLMMTDQKISLENIREFANVPNIPQNTPMETPQFPQPLESVRPEPIQPQKEEEEEIDIEGDLQVENITKRSLEILQYIQMNRWVQIEENTDSDSDSSDLADAMNYESIFTHSDNNSESLQFVDSESSHDDNLIGTLFW
jgi:hypothetical protein